MKPYTREDADRIRAILDSMPKLAVGMGTKKMACSVSAIQLGLTGELTDKTPDCMSEVIGAWMRRINDAIPAAFRDSREWRELLPLATGTGREHEKERIDIVLTWLWEDVLPQVQPLADAEGFGGQWRYMIEERTAEAAKAAADAAADVAAESAAARAALAATWAADEAEWAAAWAAAEAASWAASWSAAEAASWDASWSDDIQYFWTRADPVELLRRLIQVNPPKWEAEA